MIEEKSTKRDSTSIDSISIDRQVDRPDSHRTVDFPATLLQSARVNETPCNYDAVEEQSNQDEDVQNSFDLKMWACVSASFEVEQITTNMLESTMKERSKINNQTPLQDALKGKMMVSNNFLLVDSVWSVKNYSH